MVGGADLEIFLMRELRDPDLDIAADAASPLRDFDLILLDRLPDDERQVVVDAFLGGLPPRPPSPPPLPSDMNRLKARPVRRIDKTDIGNGVANLKRSLDARGLDNMSPQARALFLSCNCWPL